MGARPGLVPPFGDMEWHMTRILIHMNDQKKSGRIMMEIIIPEDVKVIITMIEHSGHEAYVVGGCVRDILMGREPDDWDITTSATPEEIKRIFVKTVDTGIKHGTVTVIVRGNGYEVTTYRIDGDYADGRHPQNVRFTRNLREDLKRRDFTINAIAYNEKNGIKDEFGGIGDLERHLIKAVGDPFERFTEDALRMLRAIRFSAQLGFNIDGNTYNAICAMSGLIKNVSIERVQAELTKTLLSPHPELVTEFQETGLFIEILPELNRILSSRDAKFIRPFLNHVPATVPMRYAALLSGLDHTEAKKVMKSLRLDNNTIDTATQIIRYSKEEEKIPENEYGVRKAMSKYGPRLLENLFIFADARIQTGEDVTGLTMRGQRLHLRTIKRYCEEIISRGDCVNVKDLDISGTDLVNRGLRGEKVGETLEWLLDIVLENPRLNDKETLMAMLDNRF